MPAPAIRVQPCNGMMDSPEVWHWQSTKSHWTMTIHLARRTGHRGGQVDVVANRGGHRANCLSGCKGRGLASFLTGSCERYSVG
jgi:hypothetical protein